MDSIRQARRFPVPSFLQEASSYNGNNGDTLSDLVGQNIGDWEEIHGNYVLRPSLNEGSPRALLHFLGGALVGHGLHISYRYVLERLASEGYLIVATPYNLSFDHLTTCDDIIARFERIAPSLARTYGALPVVGVGHSCGALLQLMIASLFPDTPRAANALISYNNKPVSEAVPFFEEFFVPFFTYVAAKNDTSRNSGSEVIRVGLDLAIAASKGEIPSDELLAKASKVIVPPALGRFIPTVAVPGVLRDAFSTVTKPATAALSDAGLIPLTVEVLEAFQQIPMLIDEVADGARDFVPAPAQVKSAARRSYRARRTLLIQYTEDPLDESDEIEELLMAAGQMIRMKRPMIEIDLRRVPLSGGHAAPLLAPPLDLAQRAETLLGEDVAKERLLYTQADQTVQELVRWLEEANL
jgi:acetyl esterase/lipase